MPTSEGERRRAQTVASELLSHGSAAGRVKPGYMMSSNGADETLIGEAAKEAFARHRLALPKGARLVEQVSIKGYPVTFYDMPKRSFLARLADSVRGQK
jgi:hypothetical protein